MFLLMLPCSDESLNMCPDSPKTRDASRPQGSGEAAFEAPTGLRQVSIEATSSGTVTKIAHCHGVASKPSSVLVRNAFGIPSGPEDAINNPLKVGEAINTPPGLWQVIKAEKSLDASTVVAQ